MSYDPADATVYPADEGLPEYADDDSFANPEDDLGRAADGPDPAAMPAEREDTLAGLDDAIDEPSAASVAERTRQEEPDIGTSEQSADGLDPDSRDAADPGLDDVGAEEELPGSEVGEARPGPVVHPDQGEFGVADQDIVARDPGTAGGGKSPEERALHDVAEEEQ